MNDTEEKKQEVIKELTEWFSRPNCRSFYFEEPSETIRKNLQEETIKKSTWLSFDQLRNWHYNSFVHSGLVNNDLSDRNSVASLSYSTSELTNIFAGSYPNNPPSRDLHQVASNLADAVIQKWDVQAQKMLDWILSGLETTYLNGGQNYKIAGWFIISVACRAFDKQFEQDKYNYPADMGDYQKVIDNWNTNDTNDVDKMVSKLCDYHLKEAYYDENNPLIIQFSYTNEFVYAFEILSWLAMREINGLKNPDKFSHPLMALTINMLPTGDAPYQPTDLYSKVLDQVMK